MPEQKISNREKIETQFIIQNVEKVELPNAEKSHTKRKIFNVPQRPIQGVFGRERDVDILFDLIKPNTEIEIMPIALVGMGGIGKTTLSIEIAYIFKKYFSDGIFWIELGPKPSIRQLLNDCGRKFDIDLTAFRNEESCSERLRELLQDYNILLIIDDVWDSYIGTLFKIGGYSSRTIFTTREKSVANDLVTHSGIYDVNTISPEASLQLLYRLAPEIVQFDKMTAMQLCEQLEFLPLAITLAGRYLANEALTSHRKRHIVKQLLSSSEERLSLFQFERRLGIEDTRPSLRAILGLSVERLERIDQERFALLSLLGGEPLSWSIDWITSVWDCTEEEAEKTIIRFIQRGLIEQRGDDYRMHALLADYAEILRKEWNL